VRSAIKRPAASTIDRLIPSGYRQRSAPSPRRSAITPAASRRIGIRRGNEKNFVVLQTGKVDPQAAEHDEAEHRKRGGKRNPSRGVGIGAAWQHRGECPR
jgi:hypothetical protein